MAKQSLFQILSRQPWWLTLLVAVLIFSIMQLIFPPLAPFVALPFAAVAAYLGWRQLRAGLPVNVEERLATLRAMPWENFSALVKEAYRRQGYAIEDSKSAAFDFRLAKNGQVTLVQCRRWKVNQVGASSLHELAEVMETAGAFRGVSLTAGEFSGNAWKFAAGKPITLVTGSRLVELIGSAEKKRWRWFGG